MSTGTPVYPATLDTDASLGPTSGIVPGLGGTHLGDAGVGQGTLLGITTNLINTAIAIETKLGITNSTDITSHEYRLRKRPWKVWSAYDAMPATTNYATMAYLNSIPVLVFNDGSRSPTATACFMGIVPWGAILTNGVIVRLVWVAPSNAGACRWSVAFERFGVTDVTTDHFDVAVLGVGGASGTPNVAVSYSPVITAIGGAVAGDPFRIQVTRIGPDPLDTIGGDVRLFEASIESV